MELDSDKAISAWLKEKYPVESRMIFEHPDAQGPQEATIIAHTTDNEAHPLANGIRLQFADGVFIDVPAGHLEK